MMDAECLLGEFRDLHRLKILSTEKGDIWKTYNTETGQLDDEDARLGALPPGWVAVEGGKWQDEKGVVTEDDPRWTPGNLRNRGIKLEMLDLV
jgi:hypothetical protein